MTVYFEIMSDSLNIQKSLNKARWAFPDPALAQVEEMARRHDLPEVVARLLCVRGVSVEDAPGFLNPTLREHFPDPFDLQGMEAMTGDIAADIQAGKHFAIFGDFDVDGATSSAVMYRFLKACGIEARIYIPERLTEGYGPNIEALQTLKEEGAEVLFMLDCGTTAFDTIKVGADMGLKIVIVDHHEAEEALPAAAHVINPKRKDDASDLDMLAAVGVTYLCCVALNAKLRAAGFYKGREEPDLRSWLDLVALGTVCDMVPLAGPNRLFTKHGFRIMQKSGNVGLKALIEVSRISGEINTFHAGFALGPRINAGSRVHKSDLGARLLTLDDPEEAGEIAWTLSDCNDKRKDIQKQMEFDAINRVEDEGLDQAPVIIVEDDSFHQGLSGLVAGRLKDKYGKPACVISFTENGEGVREGRGSGRSIPGIHIAQAFMDACGVGLLEKGGGHAMAGGFTVLPEKLEDFKAYMQEHIGAQMQSTDTQIQTDIDSIITVRGVNPNMVRLIQNSIGPFGQEHPEPLFLLKDVRIHSADVLGDAHIRLMVSDWEGGPRIKAMAFRAVGTEMGEAFLKQTRSAFHLLGHMKLDNWQGRDNVEMHVRDAAFAASAEQEEFKIA